MTRVVQRNFAIAATFLSLLVAVPSSLTVALILVNSVNPLQTIFISSFHVRNESREPLRFWVAGTHKSGNTHLLPLFATLLPALPSFRTGGFHLRDQETARIAYDWDDIIFTAIIVRRANGDLYALDVDVGAHPPGCCYRNRSDAYAVQSVDTLRPATSAETAACEETSTVGVRLAAVYLCPFLPLGFYAMQRRLRPPSSHDNGAAVSSRG